MRMWNVNPAFECDAHLISEHRELHMIAGAMAAGVRLGGHVARGLIEPQAVVRRHEQLVQEFHQRRFRHRSPLESIEVPPELPNGHVCELVSHMELQRRCTWCRDRAARNVYRPLAVLHVCDAQCEDRRRRDQAARPEAEQGIAKERRSPAKT